MACSPARWQPIHPHFEQIDRPAAGRVPAVAYSRCMRTHGVPDFRTPRSADRQWRRRRSEHPGKRDASPAFKTAQQACAKLAPGGEGDGGGAAPVTSQQHREIMQFAATMRAHSVPGFPDPDATGIFHLVNINTNAPAFTTATQKCQVNGIPLKISSRQSSGPQ